MTNDTQTLTLTDFLLARIAEDEAEVARWQAAMEADEVAARGVPSWVVMAGGLKIPARVLAECEAKRRIVELCSQLHTPERHGAVADQITDCTLAFRAAIDGAARDNQILRALASVYADHPDYREEWRP